MTGQLERREEALAAVHDRLLAAVDALTSSDAWRATLDVAARFHTYSPNNVLLIVVQRPDATRVAGYRAWTQLGRQVRRGERGIAILAPVLRRPDQPASTDTPAAGQNNDTPQRRVVAGFRATHVFDIAQTDGPPLPEVRPSLLDGAAPLALWAGLLEHVAAADYTLGYGDLAPANGRTDFTDQTVLLDRGLPAAQRVKTLAHELAHIRLHAPAVRPEGCDRPRAEVEAESVAYIVTAAHGLAADDYTVPYVTGWAGGNRDLLAATATRVLGCARSILGPTEPPRPQPDPATHTAGRQLPAIDPPPLAVDLPDRVTQQAATRGVGR